MTLSRHAKLEIAIVAALLVGSCKADWEDKLDVADVYGRNAIYRVNALESRVSEIALTALAVAAPAFGLP